MAHPTGSAAAPAHPSVFTCEESAIIRRAFELIDTKRLRPGPAFYHFDDFRQYLVLRFAGLVHEQFHVLYLDVNDRLLAAEHIATGDQKSVTPNFRHIAFRAIELGANSVVLAHNHPNDNPTPSDADVIQLTWAEKSLAWLNIEVRDSYVVTAKRITSVKLHRVQLQEMDLREREAAQERRSAERRAKIAATKAAKRAAARVEASTQTAGSLQ